MKKKIVTLLIAASMVCAPAAVYAAEDTDARIATLESEVTSLKERIDALEQLVGTTSREDTASTPSTDATETPAEQTSEESELITMTYDDCTFTYDHCELGSTYSGNPCLIIYGYFENHSDEAKSSMFTFQFNAYQNSRELSMTVLFDNPAYSDSSTNILDGSDPIYVAYAYELQDTESEVLLWLSPLFDFSGKNKISLHILPSELQ